MKRDPESNKGYLTLTKIGTIRVKLHRNIEGTIKTVTIKREGEQWFVVFSCEMEKPAALPVSYEDAGIDLGVTHFAALSNGEFSEAPGHYRKAEKKLKKMQASLARKKHGSHRRARVVKRIAKAHRKIRQQRRDFTHKAARHVNPYKTSQLCSGCGREVKKDLSERWHRCECGTELDRNTNAALNILKLGHKLLLGGTRPTSATA